MIITAQELQNWIDSGQNFQALDIRPAKLKIQLPIMGLQVLPAEIKDLKKKNGRKIVLICQFGLITEEIIIDNHLHNTFSLLGGAEAWHEYQESKTDFSRYARQMALPELGLEGQKKINNASIGIVGLGGLGAAAAQILTAAGIGKLCLIDGDIVEISNIHRQPLYREIDVNKKKVNAAAENLSNINPAVTIKCIDEFLDKENGVSILSGTQIIIDATDNLNSRLTLNNLSQKLNIPLIYGGLFRFEGQVAVLNYEGCAGYEDIFPQTEDSEISRLENLEADNCRDGGVLGMLPGIIGNMQALEALKIITGIKPVLSGKILIYDGLTHQTEILKITKQNHEN